MALLNCQSVQCKWCGYDMSHTESYSNLWNYMHVNLVYKCPTIRYSRIACQRHDFYSVKQGIWWWVERKSPRGCFQNHGLVGHTKSHLYVGRTPFQSIYNHQPANTGAGFPDCSHEHFAWTLANSGQVIPFSVSNLGIPNLAWAIPQNGNELGLVLLNVKPQTNTKPYQRWVRVSNPGNIICGSLGLKLLMGTIPIWQQQFHLQSPNAPLLRCSCGYLCHGAWQHFVDLRGTQGFMASTRNNFIWFFKKYSTVYLYPGQVIIIIYHQSFHLISPTKIKVSSQRTPTIPTIPRSNLFELTAGCAPCLCLAQAGTR